MNVKTANSINQNSECHLHAPEILQETESQNLRDVLHEELRAGLKSNGSVSPVAVESRRAQAVINRIVQERSHSNFWSNPLLAADTGTSSAAEVSIILQAGFKARAC